MKRFQTTALLAAMLSISAAAIGCGSSNNNPGQPGGLANPAFGGPRGYVNPGAVQTASGAAQVVFTGQNVYDSGVRITGTSAGVYAGSQGNLMIGSGALPGGGAGSTVLSGTSAAWPGCTVQLTTSNVSALAVNVAGSVTLSPQFMQANLPQGIGALQGIGIDLWMTGNVIYGGGVYLYTSIGAAGLHGAYLSIDP